MSNHPNYETSPENGSGRLFDPESPPQKPPEQILEPSPAVELTGAGLTLEQDADFDLKDSQGQFTPRMIRPSIGVEDPDFSPKKIPKSPAAKGPRPPRSRKGFSARELRIADGPPPGYDGR